MLIAYTLALASCLVARSKLYGSLISRDFALLSASWLLGLVSASLGLSLRALGWLGQDQIYLWLLVRALSFHIPVLLASLALAHMALLYSRYSRPP
ncbi:hypothetical protein DRO32_04285 [Candidatus Bathyarchaeota archaeon]|nr:MAG: hypothetical protein DRO32_04285 [Candidatus Bathyarchaeota archaeon]